MPTLLTQVQEALGLPPSAVPPLKAPAPAAPLPSTSRSTAPPVLPSSAPPIVAEASDSDDSDVQTIPVPFRSGNSDTYLPMISLDDSWHSDNEFRFVFSIFSVFYWPRMNLSKKLILSMFFVKGPLFLKERTYRITNLSKETTS